MDKILIVLMIIWLPFEVILKYFGKFISVPSSETRKKWNKSFYDLDGFNNDLSRREPTDNWFMFLFGIAFILFFVSLIPISLWAAKTGAIWAIIPG